jgi:hypothetical protein
MNALYVASVTMSIFCLNFKFQDILIHSSSEGSCVHHRITGYSGERMETGVEGMIVEQI